MCSGSGRSWRLCGGVSPGLVAGGGVSPMVVVVGVPGLYNAGPSGFAGPGAGVEEVLATASVLSLSLLAPAGLSVGVGQAGAAAEPAQGGARSVMVTGPTCMRRVVRVSSQAWKTMASDRPGRDEDVPAPVMVAEPVSVDGEGLAGAARPGRRSTRHGRARSCCALPRRRHCHCRGAQRGVLLGCGGQLPLEGATDTLFRTDEPHAPQERRPAVGGVTEGVQVRPRRRRPVRGGPTANSSTLAPPAAQDQSMKSNIGHQV